MVSLLVHTQLITVFQALGWALGYIMNKAMPLPLGWGRRKQEKMLQP